MKLYNLSITKHLKNGCRVANDWRNLTMVQAQGYLQSVVADPTLEDFTISMTCSDTGKHPKPFAKTKAGAKRRAQARFKSSIKGLSQAALKGETAPNWDAQAAYDDLWGPPLENPMDYEQ